MRAYLMAQKVSVPAIEKDADGNLTVMLTDPDQHKIEFVQYVKGAIQSWQLGQSLPATRVSQRIIHVGLNVTGQVAEDRFIGTCSVSR